MKLGRFIIVSLFFLTILISPANAMAKKVFIEGVPFVSESPGFDHGGWYCAEAAFLSVKRYWYMEGELNYDYADATYDALYDTWLLAGQPYHAKDDETLLPDGSLHFSDLSTAADNTDHLSPDDQSSSDEDLTISFIEGNIDKGYPVIIVAIVGLAASGTGHFVVIVGYDQVLDQNGQIDKAASKFYIRDNLNHYRINEHYEATYSYEKVLASMLGISSFGVMNALALVPDGNTARETTPCPAGYKNYTDIADASWFIPYVVYLTCKGVINGHPDGAFRPDMNVNRAEFLKMVAEATGTECLPDGSPNDNCPLDPPYIDINKDDWFYKYVDVAYNYGWVYPNPDDTYYYNPIMKYYFLPGTYASRGEVAEILVRALNRENDSYSQASPFADISYGDEYYKYAVIANDLGIFHGYSSGAACGESGSSDKKYFCPDKNINRAEVSKVICISVYELDLMN